MIRTSTSTWIERNDTRVETAQLRLTLRVDPGAPHGGVIHLGLIRRELGDPAAAEAAFREAWELRRSLPDGSPLRAEAALELGTSLTALGRYGEAETRLLESYRSYWEGGMSEELRRVRAELVVLYEAWGKPGSAEAYRETAEARGG